MYPSNRDRFAQAPKDLQITNLPEIIRIENQSQSREDLEDNKEYEIKTENEYTERSILDIADETINHGIPGLKKFVENSRMGNPSQAEEALANNEQTACKNIHEDKEEQIEKHNAGGSLSNISDENIINLGSGKKLYKVEEC